MAEGESDRRKEMLTRRSQDPMLVRPRVSHVMYGIPSSGK